MPDTEVKLVHLQEAKSQIQDSDLLLFRKPGFIASMGRGIHSHAAKIAWWGEELFCLEVLQLKGGRAVTLQSQVKGWPGRYDVYKANPNDRFPGYNRAGATEFMKELCGCGYGYTNLWYAALLHMPIVRLFVSASMEDQQRDKRPSFCSQACAMADRIGGHVDPVAFLADRLTEPADLARSLFYEYMFTLIP